MPIDMISFDVYRNPRNKTSVEGKIGYRGPLQRRASVPKIKLDITDDECLVLEPVWRTICHPYSDQPEGGLRALCYCYEELFAEKSRALVERLRPRDLYDVVHLYQHNHLLNDRTLVVNTLKEKCAFKKIGLPTFGTLEAMPKGIELETEGENMRGTSASIDGG
jgi:predicted nucleotidyltransferase component of viral defense system